MASFQCVVVRNDTQPFICSLALLSVVCYVLVVCCVCALAFAANRAWKLRESRLAPKRRRRQRMWTRCSRRTWRAAKRSGGSPSPRAASGDKMAATRSSPSSPSSTSSTPRGCSQLANGEVMPERKGVVPAWQDVPPEAKLSLTTLRKTKQRLPIAVLSYGFHRGAAAPPQAGPTAHGPLLPARCAPHVSGPAPGGVGHNLGFPVAAAARVHDGLQRGPRRQVSVPARALLAGLVQFNVIIPWCVTNRTLPNRTRNITILTSTAVKISEKQFDRTFRNTKIFANTTPALN